MLNAAGGQFDDNPVKYMNIQMQYHLGYSKQDLSEMTDEEWAEEYNILSNIRKEEAKQKPFG